MVELKVSNEIAKIIKNALKIKIEMLSDVFRGKDEDVEKALKKRCLYEECFKVLNELENQLNQEQ